MLRNKLFYYFWADILDYRKVYFARTNGILILFAVFAAIRVASEYADAGDISQAFINSSDLLGTFLLVFAVLMLPFLGLRLWAKYRYIEHRFKKDDAVWGKQCDPWQLYQDYDAQK